MYPEILTLVQHCLIRVRRFSSLLCHYELRHPEEYNIRNLDRLREMYGIKFTGQVGYNIADGVPMLLSYISPCKGVSVLAPALCY